MHETSLVKGLLLQVQQVLRENRADTASNITIEIGPLSGVEPDLVQSAFDRLIPGTALADATLTIQEIPLQAICVECGRSLEVRDFRFRCPHCDSGNVQVTSGDQICLKTVSLAAPRSIEEVSHG